LLAPETTEAEVLPPPKADFAKVGSSDEWEYFEFWCTNVSMAGFFSPKFLCQLLPQIARQAPAVLHLGAAIGALSVSKFFGQRILCGGSFQQNSCHYSHALLYYSRAVATVRQMGDSTTNLLLITLACMLFCIFEFFHSNPQALAQIKHGLRILEDYRYRRATEAGVSSSKLQMDSLESEIMSIYQRAVAYPITGRLIGTEPMFNKVPWCCAGRHHKYIYADMPATFEDFDEARYWWEKTFHFVMHRATNNEQHFSLLERDQGFGISVEALHTWRNGFLPLLYHARQSQSNNLFAYMQAITLEAAYRQTYMDAVGELDGISAQSIAPALPLFQEIVSVCKKVMQAMSRNPEIYDKVALEQGISSPLNCLAYTCKDPSVLAEAVLVLTEGTRIVNLPPNTVLICTSAVREYGSAIQNGTGSAAGGAPPSLPQIQE
jgi:hypothetical protein